MAAVEVSQAFISAAKSIMTGDATLRTIVGLSTVALLSERIRYVEAHADPGEDEEPKEFFICHEIDLDYGRWPDLSGRYIQTINDYGDNAAMLLQVVRRLKGLFIERRLAPPSDEFSACRIYPLDAGSIPTGDDLRWQHAIIWQVSLFAKDEVTTVLAR